VAAFLCHISLQVRMTVCPSGCDGLVCLRPTYN
jgi:hypothetical protein